MVQGVGRDYYPITNVDEINPNKEPKKTMDQFADRTRPVQKPGAHSSHVGAISRFRFSRSQILGGITLLLPATVLLMFIFYMPVGTVLLEGFRSPVVSGPAFSLSRLTQLITDPYILRLIRFTSWQALLSALLSTAIGLPLAYLLANRSFRGKSFLSSFMMVPFFMPAVTVALGFLLMFGTNGWFNGILHSAFGVKIRILHTIWAIVIAHAFYNGPLVARMTQGTWERLDPALEESARTLGAGRFAVWRDVTLPAIFPGLLSGGLLAFIYSFMSFPIVLSLGGSRFSTVEVEIYTLIRVLLDYEMGAALAGIQAGLSLVFAYFFLKVEGRVPYMFASTRGRRLTPLFSRSLKDWWVWIFVFVTGILFIGPIASIIVDSVTNPSGDFSFLSYARIFTADHNFHLGGPPVRSIQNSVKFGLTAAFIALAAGVTFSYGIVRFLRRPIPFMETLTLAPIVVSSVALAYGILIAFRKAPLNVLSADLAIPMVHAVLAFPFVVRAFRPVLQSVDTKLIEAARTLGATRWRAFVDVELPMTMTGLLIAFAISFGLSVSEMTATLMLSRPDQVTMPVSVYRFLASRDFQSAAAMAVILMAVTGGVFLLTEMSAGYMRRRIADEGVRRFYGN